MEWTFYDVSGRAIAYCDDGRHIYAFSGMPLAYLDDDSVYSFGGQHLGWWDRAWIRDHHGAWVFFTEAVAGLAQRMPTKQARPTKVFKSMLPMRGSRDVKPLRAPASTGWSSRSGIRFFTATY